MFSAEQSQTASIGQAAPSEATPHSICGLCLNLDPSYGSYPSGKVTAWILKAVFELEKSANSGCSFCSLIMEISKHFVPSSSLRSVEILLQKGAATMLFIKSKENTIEVEVFTPQGEYFSFSGVT